MSEPRRHHYVPQFYLRGFSKNRRRIFRIERDTGLYVPVNIRETAAIRDYNELDYEGAPDRNAVEKALGELEGELAKDMDALLAKGINAKQELCEIICLLVQLRLRIPAFKKHIQSAMEEQLRETAKALEREGRLPKPPPGLEGVLAVENFRFSIKNWFWLQMVFEQSSSPDTLEIYSRMRVQLLRSTGSSFITSDQPVSLFHPEVANLGWYGGVGPATPGVEIFLPLSSKAGLLLDHGPTAQVEREAYESEIHELNRRTIVGSDALLFSEEPPSSALLGLLEKERTNRSGFTFGTLRPGGQLYQVHRFTPVGPAK